MSHHPEEELATSLTGKDLEVIERALDAHEAEGLYLHHDFREEYGEDLDVAHKALRAKLMLPPSHYIEYS